ncbi:MAG: hypothetical protein ACAH88_03335, partial [Roseimicrobium sp.]
MPAAWKRCGFFFVVTQCRHANDISLEDSSIAPGGSTDGSRSVEGAQATATTGSGIRLFMRPGGHAG